MQHWAHAEFISEIGNSIVVRCVSKVTKDMIDYRLEHISMFALRIGVFIEVSPCMSCARISNQPRVLGSVSVKIFWGVRGGG